MRTVELDAKTMEKFAASPGGAEPIVMVNLLRYREQAAYPTRSSGKRRSVECLIGGEAGA